MGKIAANKEIRGYYKGYGAAMDAVQWFLNKDERWVKEMIAIGLHRRHDTNVCIETLGNMLYTSHKYIVRFYREPFTRCHSLQCVVDSPSLKRYQAMASPELGVGLADRVLSTGDHTIINTDMPKTDNTIYPTITDSTIPSSLTIAATDDPCNGAVRLRLLLP